MASQFIGTVDRLVTMIATTAAPNGVFSRTASNHFQRSRADSCAEAAGSRQSSKKNVQIQKRQEEKELLARFSI